MGIGHEPVVWMQDLQIAKFPPHKPSLTPQRRLNFNKTSIAGLGSRLLGREQELWYIGLRAVNGCALA